MKSLELTIYPKVDRWVDWTMEFLGKTVKGSSRECGYETPRGVFDGDEWPEKRLSDAEFSAEYHAWDAHLKHLQWCELASGDELSEESWRKLNGRLETLWRFANRPHYDEAGK